MATFLLLLQLAIVLAMIYIGAKVGGIGLGIYGMVGVFVLVFIFGLPPGVVPIDVMLIIVCAIKTLTEECVLGITVNKERCMEMVKNSIDIVTALNPYIGYKTSTKIAKEALETNRSVYDIVLEKGLMTQEKLDEALNPVNMLASH